MADYWVKRDGERLGPFDEARILGDYERGLLRPDDLLWAEGMKYWVPAEDAFAEMRRPVGDSGPLELEPFDSPVEDGGPEAQPMFPGESAREMAAHGEPAHRLARDDGVYYAGFWVRLGAVMIDSVILSLLTFVVFLILELLSGWLGIRLGFSDSKLDAYSIVISWLYFAGLEGGEHNATIGKRVFHLQALHADDLTGYGFFVGTARFTVSLLSALLLLIGYLMQPFTRRKQALHDLATGTVVVVSAPYSVALLIVAIVLGAILNVGLLWLWAVRIMEQAGL